MSPAQHDPCRVKPSERLPSDYRKSGQGRPRQKNRRPGCDRRKTPPDAHRDNNAQSASPNTCSACRKNLPGPSRRQEWLSPLPNPLPLRIPLPGRREYMLRGWKSPKTASQTERTDEPWPRSLYTHAPSPDDCKSDAPCDAASSDSPCPPSANRRLSECTAQARETVDGPALCNPTARHGSPS